MTQLENIWRGAAVAALVIASGFSAPAAADDTEVFFFRPPDDTGDRPNVLFILDSGESLAEPVDEVPDYEPGKIYDSSGTKCEEDLLYFGFSGTGEPTSCAGLKYVPRSNFVCDAARPALESLGKALQPQMIVYGTASNNKRWGHLNDTNTTGVVECYADRGKHSDGTACGSGTNNVCYAVDNQSRPWGKQKNGNTNNETTAFLGAPPQTFYTANRIAYHAYLETLDLDLASTRMDALKRAMKSVLSTVKGVNVGLMRFAAQGSNGAQTSGGMVINAIAPIEASLPDLIETLDGQIPACRGQADCPYIMAPLGRKPIGETMYEAELYFAGATNVFGWKGNIGQAYPFPSVWPSWSDTDPGRKMTGQDAYISPTKGQVCSSDNFIVLLTDGFTEQDRSSDAGSIQKLPGFPSSCETTVYEIGADGKPDYSKPFDTKVLSEDMGNIKGTPEGAAQGSFCVDDLAGYMYEQGIIPGNANKLGTGESRIKVKTFTIGFDLDRLGEYGKAARRVLVETADRGGGEFAEARGQIDLEAQLTSILRKILVENSSFTSPSVAVNSFNRTQNLNDLYFSVFKPDFTYRWKGNVKRYRLVPTPGPQCDPNQPCDPNDIWDANNLDAVELDQEELLRFKATARSYWSDVVDGFDAAKGGAAGEITAPDSRKIYSNLKSESGLLTEQLSELAATTSGSEMKLANQLLLGVDSSDPVDGRPTPVELVDWAYGFDAAGNARMDMGDPLHSKPAVVTYGGTATNPEVVVFVTTNDGFLHAFRGGAKEPADARTDGGDELWAFIPRQLLRRIEKLHENPEVTTREYGLDSPIRTLRFDKDQDGQIEVDDGDRVVLYFGMRRGGLHYFAVDVTDPSKPNLLWRIGAPDDHLSAGSDEHLPGIGETWSVPTIARVNVGDHTFSIDNPLKWVLVFGGGYNVNHDRVGYLLDADGKRIFDDTGNRIYMVDAITGKLLWRAGPSTDTGAQLKLTHMRNAIASDVRVIDMSSDGFADRMYASDLGGNLWRFDIFNGKDSSELVAGGRIASLGNGDSTQPTSSADSRRFFYAPDPALITYQGQTFINVTIGSGHREKPVTDSEGFTLTPTRNRAYGIRDYYPFTPLSQAQYDDTDVVPLIRDTSSDPTCDPLNPPDPSQPLGLLFNVTTCNRAPIPAGSVGWKLDLVASGGWSGEKILAESVTFQNIAYVPSYEPGSSGDVCAPATGINRLYEISAATGATKLYWDNPTLPDSGLREPPSDLQQGGIAPPAVFIFPEGPAGGRNPNPECLVGLAECGEGASSRPVRTYWRQRGVQ